MKVIKHSFTLFILSLFLISGLKAQKVSTEAIFNKIVSSYGVNSGIKTIENYYLKGKIILYEGTEEKTGTIEIYYKFPNKYKEIIKTEDGTSETLFTNSSCYRRHLKGKKLLTRRRARKTTHGLIMGRMGADLYSLLSLKPSAVKIKLFKDFLWFGSKQYMVLKIYQDKVNFPWIKLMVDPDTYLIRLIEYSWEDPARDRSLEGTIELKDYKKSGSIMIPGTVVRRVNHVKASKITVESIEFNKSMPANVFRIK